MTGAPPLRQHRSKRTKLREIAALAISIAPLSALRALLYRLCFHYDIRATHIGFGTTIDVESFSIEHGYIGPFCRFDGPMRVHVSPHVTIGRANIFRCGGWTVDTHEHGTAYRRQLLLGAHSQVTDGHYFDVAGSFSLGEGSRVAGYGSQFWTHGAGVIDRDVHIGKDCFIGSAVRFAPGSRIGDRCVVAMGSVVAGTLMQDGALIAGVPAIAKQTQAEYAWRPSQDDVRRNSSTTRRTP